MPAIATGISVIMLIIAVAGIRLSARTQVAIGVIEYLILIVLAVGGLSWVLGHHAGTFSVTASWFSLHGIGGKGSLAAGFLITVFMYSGWDGTVYVNEEVRHRSRNPGRAAIAAVAITGALFVLAQTGMQGVVPPAKLQANSAAGLVYIGTVLGGSSGGRAAALALALSVVAATGAGILLTARILYGMASRHVLPSFLGNVSGRFRTPVAATVLSGLVLIVLAWFYLLSTSIAAAFSDVISITGLLYASFYVLTALAAIVYYRRRILSDAKELLTLGILPLGAIGFLAWVIVKTVTAAPRVQNESLAGVVITGLILMLIARFGMKSSFFQVPNAGIEPRSHRREHRPGEPQHAGPGRAGPSPRPPCQLEPQDRQPQRCEAAAPHRAGPPVGTHGFEPPAGRAPGLPAHVVIVSREARAVRGRVRRVADLAGNGVSARWDEPGRCAHHGSLDEALSRGIWKNGERSANHANNIKTTPTSMMPATDHRWDAGAACSDLTTIQARNAAAANGRRPASSASQALLNTRAGSTRWWPAR
jgi:hypothetical protein